MKKKENLRRIAKKEESSDFIALTRQAVYNRAIYWFQEALVFAGRELEIQFRMSRPLTDFMATLHKNGIEEKRLSKYVTHSIADDDVVTFSISFPEEGQYGLDVYTRESTASPVAQHDVTGEKHLLTHCCKYLINSSKRN